MKHKAIRKWLVIGGVFMLAGLVLLTGCNPQNSAAGPVSRAESVAESTAPADESTPEATEPTAGTDNLKVGMIGKDIKTACIIIAHQNGLYEEEGVSVEFETVSNLGEAITAVDLGKLDVLPFGVIPSATFVGQGSDVVVFGGTISEGSEIVVLPENADSIQTLEDFRGKKIGCYRMETGHMVTKGLLREAGINIEKDVEFVLLDSQQTIIEAVRKGEVDCGFLNSGQGYVAQQAGLAVALRVGELQADFPCCRQTTSRGVLSEKRDALVKFQIANLRALDIYLNDEAAAIAALVEYSGQPEEYVRAVMYGLDGAYENAMIVSLDPNKNKVVEFYETMKANGDIDPATSYDMADQVDTGIYKEALDALLERGGNDELYTRLMQEYEANNT